MLSADNARKKFFDILDGELARQGNPFYYARRNQYAIVNKPTPVFSKPCLSVEFLWRDKVIRISIFIENDVSLYEYLKSMQDKFNDMIDVPLVWKAGDKNKNARRICYTLSIDEYGDWLEYAKKSIMVTKEFIDAFSGYIDC